MPLEKMRIPRGASTIGGILAVPQGRGPFPGIVMISRRRAGKAIIQDFQVNDEAGKI
jgi:hypothetical protein